MVYSQAFCATIAIKRCKSHVYVTRRAQQTIRASRWRCIASSKNSGFEKAQDQPKYVLPMPDYEEPHPYGNGGVSNVPIWDGYNFEEAAEEHRQAKTAFDAYVAAESPATNRWAIVCNADGIQWNNN
eukprot:IDg9211t1